jgi:hypothetical protein
VQAWAGVAANLADLAANQVQQQWRVRVRVT